MRRLSFLLRPGWLVLAVVVAGFAYMCFTVLAPWQLGKNTSTEHRNALIEASVNADPVPIESVLPASGPIAADDEWRQVTATGTYLPDSEALVRLRSVEGDPAYEVLTPMRLTSGPVILVNRGYVRPVQGTLPPPVDPAPAGEVTVTARVRASEGVVAGKDPIVEDGHTQVYFVDAGQVGAAVGLPLVDGWFQLAQDQPGALTPIPLPQLDAGPYLSYGLQWLAFGIMAPLGLAYFVRAELRERRRERAALRTPDAPAEPTPAPPVTPAEDAPADDDVVLPRRRFGRSATTETATLTSTEAKLADRYGKRR
ncbi:SURF1 family protein [Rhodococcus sp. NPDC003318]|uniref:SURF1 family cytochrome oxidase biogenesis protein n=1 Tax=Rhodococcus sp. NPDC003318 TaxID=3364503 RepID=UPI00367AA254